MPKFQLDVSPEDAYYALYRLRHGERKLVQNLSTLYARAVVKASVLAGDSRVTNLVPEELRYFCGDGQKRSVGTKKGVTQSVFSFGKHKGKSIKQVMAAHPPYADWFFSVMDERDGAGEWILEVLDAKAWMAYYRPDLLRNMRGGALYTGYQREASPVFTPLG